MKKSKQKIQDFLDGKRLTVECRIIVDKVTGIR